MTATVYLLTSLFQSIRQVTCPLHGLPHILLQRLPARSGRGDGDGHNDCRRKRFRQFATGQFLGANALVSYFDEAETPNIYRFISHCSDSSNEHVRIGHQLGQFGKLWTVMVADELYNDKGQ